VRVVHVYKDAYPVVGGIERTLGLLTHWLSRRPGIEPWILVTSRDHRPERTTLDGVPVFKAPRLATVAQTPLSVSLGGALRALRPDLVHLHFPYPVGEVSYLLATPHVPLVMTYHSDIVRQRRLLRVYGPLLERVLARADAILPTSPQYLASSPWLQPHHERCHVVPSSIDVGAAMRAVEQAAAAAARLRARYAAQPLLLFVGRFRYYKGLAYLLDALPRVPRGHLLLVGEGPEEPALRAQVQQLGLAERVTFAGAVPDADLPAYHGAADLYVLPACLRSEAFGLGLLEAQAAALPAVTTELGTGTSYVNLDGETGLVVPPMQSAALAGAINALLEDEPRRRAMGEAARRRAATLFDMEPVVDQVAAIYSQVLAGSSSRR
jgi:rhamnosyl/mannosyltransferase